MKIYAFRQRGDHTFSIKENVKKQKWQGIAVAADLYDLFWQIDDYANPYACEFIEYDRPFSLCAMINGSGDDVRLIDVELSDDVFDHFSDEEQWKRSRSFEKINAKTKTATLAHRPTNEESK